MARPLSLDRKVKKLILMHGPLAAGFMAQAITSYCNQVTALPVEELQKQLGGMFDAASWQRIATDVNQVLGE